MIATNNVFNIRVASSWLGAAGSAKGFVCFKSRDYAIRAWLILMRTYRRKYFCMTVQSIVTRFAPPTENDTRGYISFVCSRMAIAPDYRLTADTQYYRLGVAMAVMETGTKLTMQEIQSVAHRFGIVIVP